jgi:hypothetical protein
MVRVTKTDLEAEIVKLKAELAKLRRRSRSPRRDEIIADSTPSRRAEALGYVAAHTFIRSEAETRMKVMIDERDATIAKQANIIADLEVGKGPIGPVLAGTFEFSHDIIERPELKVSVATYIKDIWSASNNCQGGCCSAAREPPSRVARRPWEAV